MTHWVMTVIVATGAGTNARSVLLHLDAVISCPHVLRQRQIVSSQRGNTRLLAHMLAYMERYM